jgi:hypothetical protein
MFCIRTLLLQAFTVSADERRSVVQNQFFAFGGQKKNFA